jgi:mevalonate kinase
VVTSATVRAPGKAILFGEHAVVHGEGAIAVALSLHFEVSVHVAKSEPTRVDGRPLERRHHAYFMEAVAREWGGRGPLEIRTRSTLPSSSGLGSSAALTVATVGALRLLRGRLDAEAVARAGFDVEYAVQGRASPTDTSVSAHGRAIYIAPRPSKDLLWTIERDGKRWCIHDLSFPPMDFVIGFTGRKGNTGELVEGVRKRMEASQDARDRVRAIGELVERARAALAAGDRRAVGALMDENQEHLAALGVSSPALEALIEAARPHALGAKLTGAGVGGCMIALTQEPERCARAVKEAGGTVFRAVPDLSGVTAL